MEVFKSIPEALNWAKGKEGFDTVKLETELTENKICKMNRTVIIIDEHGLLDD